MSPYVIVLAVIVLTFCYVAFNYVRIRKMSEGTAEMAEMAAIIRSGSSTFMKTEYKTISIVVVLVALVFSLFIEKTSGITFIMGAAMSSIVCVLGMRSATYANVRTANKARESLSIGETVKVALCGGSISGLAVQAFGMFGLVSVLLMWGGVDADATGTGFLANLTCNPSIMRISTYSLGCSVVAMFNRVAGGNYTKAADISADILAKIRHDMPEDDSRVPNVVADFIGDNVNDIAGNCSDLLESFVATMAAAIMIAVSNFAPLGDAVFSATAIFPIILAGGGLLGCLLGLGFAAIRKMGDNPSRELNLATWISAGLTIIIGLVASYVIFKDIEIADFRLGWWSPWISGVLGIICGIAIGTITEYYTSADFKPTQQLAEMAKDGESFVITKGDAVGSRSCLAPILLIGIALVLAGIVCGTYGIAIASLGMLAFVGATVSIDAFGPIADNAGGLAESCHLAPEVRVITDKLDSVGNTTAAIGKGFAIGSAALATLSMMTSYIFAYTPAPEVSNFTEGALDKIALNVIEPAVLVGAIVGAALPFMFSGMLINAVAKAARKMVEEVRRQFRTIKGILTGDAEPDYERCVMISTRAAQQEMIVPSLIAIAIPILTGVVFGVSGVLGLLIGSLSSGFVLAVFMANAGGAWDNAKKYIEEGNFGGKGSEAHKAAVTGDTVGDPFKDTSGPSINILIKLMTVVALVFAPVFLLINAGMGLL